MKTTILKTVGVTAVCLALAAVAEAQNASTPQLPSSAQQISWGQVPPSGTFWVMGPSGSAPPYPRPPAYLSGVAPVYLLDNGQYLVDARNVKNVGQLSMAAAASSQQFGPLDSLQSDPPFITSNAWFSQIVISNHTYVSLGASVLDGIDGSLRYSQLPAGLMFPITTTNLTTPLSQWTPIGFTNSIANTTFELPYDPASVPVAFYRACAQTNGEPLTIPPFLLMLTNFGIQTDEGVTLSWTNGQPGQDTEFDAIVENDTNGHSYLVGTATTEGASNSFSFELTAASSLQFVRYSFPAPITQDQFFLTTSNFNEPDVVTIPYVANTNTGRQIIDVSVYDVTDPSDEQLLAEVDGTNSNQGTLEIPGISIWPGVDDLEFRVTDSAFSQTATDLTITNNRDISIVEPFLSLEPDGTNRIAASSGGYGVALHLVTEATSGTWDIKQYAPDGTLFQEVQALVVDVGQDGIYDDGSTPGTVFPDPYYDFAVTVIPDTNSADAPALSDPPAPAETGTIRVWLLPPRSGATSITAYDDTLLPSDSGDRQTVLGVMQGGESQMSAFVTYPVNIQNGSYVAGENSVAVDLNQPNGWNWTALQAMLADSSYHHYDPSSGWAWLRIGHPVNFVAVDAHGAAADQNSDSAFGLQGPPGFADSQVTQVSLHQFGFNKDTNAIAIAIFTGCKLANGPFMRFILRNRGLAGQISSATAATEHIRPCFGLGWTGDTFAGTDQWNWMSYFTLFATQLGGNGSSPFLNTLDSSVTLATQQAQDTGGDGVTWSGTQGMTLDQAAQ